MIFCLQLIVELIPDAPGRQDVAGCVRVRLDLFPQFADKRHDVAVIQQVVVRPHRPVDLFFGKHLAPVLGQKPEAMFPLNWSFW